MVFEYLTRTYNVWKSPEANSTGVTLVSLGIGQTQAVAIFLALGGGAAKRITLTWDTA